MITSSRHTQRAFFDAQTEQQIGDLYRRQVPVDGGSSLAHQAGLDARSIQSLVVPQTAARLWGALSVLAPFPDDANAVKGYCWADCNGIEPSDYPWPTFDKKMAYAKLVAGIHDDAWSVVVVGKHSNKSKIRRCRADVIANGGPFDSEVAPTIEFTSAPGFVGAVVQGESYECPEHRGPTD